MRPGSITRLRVVATRLAAQADRATDPVRDLFDPDRLRYRRVSADSIDDYHSRFVASARLFALFLRRAADLCSGNDGQRIAIVVMPWFSTPVPWFAIATGLALARRGSSVTFVWHDVPFTARSAEFDQQNDEIRRALRSLRKRFPILRLSSFRARPTACPDDARTIDDLVAQNLTWVTRGAEVLGASELYADDKIRHGLTDALPRIRSLLRTSRFDVVLVPGGVLQGSGLYLHAAREIGARAATFDTGRGWTIISTSGVAAQQTDLALAFKMLPAEPGGRGQAVIEAAGDEFERRRSGEDATSYQARAAKTVTPRTPHSILVPLSVSFDTAALGRHHLFEDSRQWLVESVATVLRATDDPVIVRQHPSERRSNERSRFNAARILSDAFGSNPQVRFLSAEDPINTYDLLDEARLVLPFVSTIGIEAAALGKPVVVGGAVYYRDLGFVWSATNREEYRELLTRGARDELPQLPNQRDLAWRCYYLNAVCQRVWTDFGCQPADYWRWVGRDPHELFEEPEVDDLLTAIEDDVPVPILRHRRRAGAKAPE